MGRNYFVSYKYHDRNVSPLRGQDVTARDYVDELQKLLSNTGQLYYRGEEDGEDLSYLSDDEIKRLISNRLFHTSITIVLITAGMMERNKPESKQWIPWEVSYSLKNKERVEGNSYMNAILAVVIPDKKGSYDYALSKDENGNIIVNEKNLFRIIRKNMFNKCDNPNYSYILMPKWVNFIKKPEYYIKLALENRRNWQDYNICKTLK